MILQVLPVRLSSVDPEFLTVFHSLAAFGSGPSQGPGAMIWGGDKPTRLSSARVRRPPSLFYSCCSEGVGAEPQGTGRCANANFEIVSCPQTKRGQEYMLYIRSFVSKTSFVGTFVPLSFGGPSNSVSWTSLAGL